MKASWVQLVHINEINEKICKLSICSLTSFNLPMAFKIFLLQHWEDRDNKFQLLYRTCFYPCININRFHSKSYHTQIQTTAVRHLQIFP